jgi:hypothetical protein
MGINAAAPLQDTYLRRPERDNAHDRGKSLAINGDWIQVGDERSQACSMGDSFPRAAGIQGKVWYVAELLLLLPLQYIIAFGQSKFGIVILTPHPHLATCNRRLCRADWIQGT